MIHAPLIANGKTFGVHISSLIADVATDSSVAEDSSSGWIIAVVAVVAIALIGVGLYLRRKKSQQPDS